MAQVRPSNIVIYIYKSSKIVIYKSRKFVSYNPLVKCNLQVQKKLLFTSQVKL